MEQINYQNTIQQDFNRLENISIRAEDLKLNVINKLSPIIGDMEIDPDNSPKKTEAKMGIVNSYLSLLDSYEKQVRDTIKAKQKQQELENDDSIGELVTTLLSDLNKEKLNNKEIAQEDDVKLETKVDEYKIVVNDGELEVISGEKKEEVKE